MEKTKEHLKALRIQYILHADFELPGIIETWAAENHCSQRHSRPFAGEKLPAPAEFDFLIVMGGPQSPLHIDKSPYLKDEISLIKDTLKAKIPVLGFCLGAQLIGEALGAKTERSPFKEVGIFPIHLTHEGHQDSILSGLPSSFPVVHWHNDMPGLTIDSKILAHSEGCPRQIVRYTSQAYGFQCHLEPTKHNIEAMILHCPEDLAPAKYVQSSSQLLSHDFNGMHKIMNRILDNMTKPIKILC